MKSYNEESIARETVLTREFLAVRNNFTAMKDEKNEKLLESIKDDMRKIFHELYPLRVELDIYTGNSNEKSIIEGLIKYLDNMRLGLVQDKEDKKKKVV